MRLRAAVPRPAADCRNIISPDRVTTPTRDGAIKNGPTRPGAARQSNSLARRWGPVGSNVGSRRLAAQQPAHAGKANRLTPALDRSWRYELSPHRRSQHVWTQNNRNRINYSSRRNQFLFRRFAFPDKHGRKCDRGINFAPIVNSGINLLFAVILGFATHYINGHIRDHQLATQLSNAVENAMGTVQQYATDSVTAGNLRLPVNSVPIQKGVEYVLANAKEALDRWPDARDRIGQKLEAKVGVVAIRAGASVPGVSGPLAPVPATRDPQRRG